MDVFISYSHKDRLWKDRVVDYLRCVKFHGGVDYASWDDGEIRPSEDWRRLITDATRRCKVAVLLVSPDFLCSEFIIEHEVPELLERRDQGQVSILPVIVRPCPWQIVDWLAKIQLHPADGSALSAGDEPVIEQSLTDLALEVHRLVSDFGGERETAAEAPDEEPGRGSDGSAAEDGSDRFMTGDELRGYLEASSGKRVIDMLKIFSTKKQRTWLFTTTGRLLYCLIDSENTRRSNRLAQWSMPLRPGMHVNARGRSRYERFGLLDIEKRQNWLYNKGLHKDPGELVRKIRHMIDEAIAK